MIVLRLIWCLLTATVYQVATNPYVLAVLLTLAGHWEAGAVLLGTFLLLCAVAVTLGVRRDSWLVSGEVIFTAPTWLFVFGDEQQGWLPQFLVDKWPRWAPHWLIAFCCCAWRNKLRNLPFVHGLRWLHRPSGQLHQSNVAIGGVVLRVRCRRWMTELEYFRGNRFGDIGPRLDQPDSWGAVSWAFRPWGRI
jgi:hypothetical protein